MRDIDNVLYTNQKHMMRLLEMLHRRLMYHYKGHIIKIGNCIWINKHHSSEFIYYACKKNYYILKLHSIANTCEYINTNSQIFDKTFDVKWKGIK